MRLVVFCALSVLFSIFGRSSLEDVFSVLATSMTILTGFTFTALFSDHSLADIGLPAPRNENDRQDIIRLGRLGQNFKFRSSYFIALSIITVIAMTVVSVEFTLPEAFKTTVLRSSLYFEIELRSETLGTLKWVSSIVHLVLVAASTFIYLECLYTFYRLSETILSIVNLRRDYIRHTEQERI